MSAINHSTSTMPYFIRPMETGDTIQLSNIEREVFPTLLPRTSFTRELQNSMAHYLVGWRLDGCQNIKQVAHSGQLTDSHNGERSLMGKLLKYTRSLGSTNPSIFDSRQSFVVGFIGAWYMVDEAHIVSIGVRPEFRRQGLGELLLISAIERALTYNMRVVTLELRISNRIAKKLYERYGFQICGTRNAYYNNDREDALIMTTDPIGTLHYQDRLKGLIQAHERRWGRAHRLTS